MRPNRPRRGPSEIFGGYVLFDVLVCLRFLINTIFDTHSSFVYFFSHRITHLIFFLRFASPSDILVSDFFTKFFPTKKKKHILQSSVNKRSRRSLRAVSERSGRHPVEPGSTIGLAEVPKEVDRTAKMAPEVVTRRRSRSSSRGRERARERCFSLGLLFTVSVGLVGVCFSAGFDFVEFSR